MITPRDQGDKRREDFPEGCCGPKEVRIAFDAGYEDGLRNAPEARKATNGRGQRPDEPKPIFEGIIEGKPAEVYGPDALDAAYVCGAWDGLRERRIMRKATGADPK